MQKHTPFKPKAQLGTFQVCAQRRGEWLTPWTVEGVQPSLFRRQRLIDTSRLCGKIRPYPKPMFGALHLRKQALTSSAINSFTAMESGQSREVQSYTNWKQKGFPGFDQEAANVLRHKDL